VLFLAGHALFKWAVFNHVPISRLSAMFVLALLLPVSLIVSPLVLAAAATLVVAGVAVRDSWYVRHTAWPQSQPGQASTEAD